MGIQELHVYGFRSLKDVHWKPGKLNLLVGPNASGKSNVLRALELMSDVASGRLVSAVRDAGGMVPLLWNQTSKSLGWKVRIDPVDEGRDPVEDALTIEFELKQLGNRNAYQISKDSFEYQISMDALGNSVRFERGEAPGPLRVYKRMPNRALVYSQQAANLVEVQGFDDNESLMSQISDPLTNPIPTLTRRVFEGWRIHHDMHVERGSPMRRSATTQFEKQVASDGNNLANVLHTLYTDDRDFREQIDDGMRAAFGSEFQEVKFPPAASEQIQLAVQWKSSKKPHAASELSDGTLRYLLLLTVLSHPNPPDLIAIDEPETGLHPNMLPLVADYAAAAAERTQVVMTSHSPEFLDVFTEDMSPTVTVCHWEEGETRLYPLTADTLKPWLERYRLGELFTRGDLDILTLPDVEQSPDLDAKLRALRQDA